MNDPKLQRRVLGLLELALELDPALRGAYLENLGRQQPELQQQVLAHLRLLGGQVPDAETTRTEPPPASSEMPERVGPYQVLREIGRGGMSRVYLAERADEEFERQVALKVIDQGLEAPIAHQRFLAERQILASFDCPQIAKLFDGGTLPNGRPYLVMELVHGIRADQHCAENRLGLEERLALFRQICGAVSYAHQQLVVHRDLKPSNILVTPGGEVKLLDFGIAKLLDPEAFPLPLSEKTRSHYRPMTPSYASPEQLLGEPIGTATDVYALGVLLFQLLTGSVPHAGEEDRLQQVLRERAGEGAPPRPSGCLETKAAKETWSAQDRRRLARQLRGDVDNIVAKALRSHPADRYAAVAELEEDLRRYSAGEPVRATRETPLYLLGKFLRRNRLPFAVAATVLLLVSAFAFISQRQAQRIAAERERADEIRYFLGDVLRSARTAQEDSGTLSLADLLTINVQRLQAQPFADPETQSQLLELLADGYRSLKLAEPAAETYGKALAALPQSLPTRARVLAKEAQLALNVGQPAAAAARVSLMVATLPAAETSQHVQFFVDSSTWLELAGDLAMAGEAIRLALQLADSPEPEPRQLVQVLRSRSDLLRKTGAGAPEEPEAVRDLVAALALRPPEQSFTGWATVAETGGRADLAAGLFLYRLARGAEPQTIFALRQLSENLLAGGRRDQAGRALAAARRRAEALTNQPSLRNLGRQLTAQLRCREAELGGGAATSLDDEIAYFEEIFSHGSSTFALENLIRLYLLAGRPEEARPLAKRLLGQGWRRPELMRLAAEKGVLPDPLPSPLELDLALPPRLRAYVDSLPHPPPPWETAADLPTLEEILAAEEAGAAESP